MRRSGTHSLYERALGEAAGKKVDSALKRKINKDLIKTGLGGKKSYRKVGAALADAMDILSKHGIEADETVSADKFRSHSREGVMGGNAVIRLAFSDPADSFNTFPITTSGLAVSWTELDRGVEVIAYMS